MGDIGVGAIKKQSGGTPYPPYGRHPVAATVSHSRIFPVKGVYDSGMKCFYLLADGHERYTEAEICSILKIAEEQGFPLESGSYVEQMTISQLADLVEGRTQA